MRMRDVDEVTILVTGSTDELARRVARDLAEKGATVLLHGRNEERGQTVLREIREESRANDQAYDEEARRKLWALSENLTGLDL